MFHVTIAVILVTKRIRLLSLWIINFRLYATHTHAHSQSAPFLTIAFCCFRNQPHLQCKHTREHKCERAHQFVRKTSRFVVSFHFIYTAHFIFVFFLSPLSLLPRALDGGWKFSYFIRNGMNYANHAFRI